MKQVLNDTYPTAAEFEVHIAEREAQANTLPPGCEMRKTILREVAQLRIYAEARQWIKSPGLKPGR